MTEKSNVTEGQCEDRMERIFIELKEINQKVSFRDGQVSNVKFIGTTIIAVLALILAVYKTDIKDKISPRNKRDIIEGRQDIADYLGIHVKTLDKIRKEHNPPPIYKPFKRLESYKTELKEWRKKDKEFKATLSLSDKQPESVK